MLGRMVKIQALAGIFETIIGQTPNPQCPIGNDQCPGSLTQPAPQCFRIELLAQAVDSFTGCHKTPFTDHRPTPSRLAPLIEPKTGAGIDPVPPVRFLATAP